MGLRINTNIDAFNAHRNLSNTSMKLARSMEKLSSGFRINRAADDAAGLGISERMRGQISGTAQAIRNTQDGISLVQTAEGSMQEFHSILGRIRELAVQYNNGVYDTAARNAITAEVLQLSYELDRMVSTAVYNGIPLLSSAAGTAMATLQIGANDGEIVAVPGINVPSAMATAGGGVVAQFSGKAASAPITISLKKLDAVIDQVSTLRSSLGAVQNRLEHTVNFLSIYQENLMASESRIRDVDMASEMTNFTKLQILQQSGTAMLAQANMSSQSVLSLFQ